MSKLEEALEKASKMRESSFDTGIKRVSNRAPVTTHEVDNPYIVTLNQRDSAIAEEYRRLKSMLIRETKSEFLNTIMITSSVDGEGKTLTSINLAISLAQELDHTILLIDADLRKPRVHEYLGVEYEYGLSDYLTSDIDISSILLKTGIGNMVIIPAGKPIQNPVELLASEKMKSLVTDIKHRYMDRYVIIDTPPVLSCSEGIILGSYVDGLVFIVREGHAQRKTIEDALNMLQGLNILGVVFNNVSEVNLDGYYSRYYYDRKKRGKDE